MSQHKLDQNGFTHIISMLLAVVVIAAIGFVGWKVQQTGTAPTSDTTSANPDSAASIISSVRASLSKQLTVQPTTKTSNEPTKAGDIMLQTDTFSPFWKVTGDDYFSGSAAGKELSISYYVPDSSNITGPDVATIQKILTNTLSTHKLTAVPTDKLSTNFDGSTTPTYQNKTTVCELVDQGSEPFDISCADLATYTAASAAIKPFATAYLSAHPSEKGVASFGIPTITKSKTVGYKAAHLTIDNAVGFFYAASDGTWKVLEVNQVGLDCDFSSFSADARLAYLGQACFDDATGKPSTVK